MSLKTLLRQGLCRSLRRARSHMLPGYPFNFNPAQLMYLCECIEHTRSVPGEIVEIGCAAGNTTVFLNKYMDAVRVDKSYVCIDTFAGFTDGDIAVEVQDRGKSASQYRTAWKDWSADLFRMTMEWNKLTRVKVIAADINDYDGPELASPSLCLIDVDLYRPVKTALHKLYPRMTHGGIIVVDDCMEGNKYDGARQAYSEFMREHNLNEHYHLGKLGVVHVGMDMVERTGGEAVRRRGACIGET